MCRRRRRWLRGSRRGLRHVLGGHDFDVGAVGDRSGLLLLPRVIALVLGVALEGRRLPPKSASIYVSFSGTTVRFQYPIWPMESGNVLEHVSCGS